MKKHTFDPLSFTFGVIFLMIAVASLITTDLDYRLSDWVLPASVLVLGVGLLAASLRGIKGGEDGSQESEVGNLQSEVGAESDQDTLVD